MSSTPSTGLSGDEKKRGGVRNSTDGPRGPPDNEVLVGRRWGRIPDAKKRTGLSRRTLYTLAARHRGLFRKINSATIVDLVRLDEILGDMPPAELAEPP